LKYLLSISLLIIGCFYGFGQSTDSTSTLLEHPWSIKVDLTRPLNTIPSIQLSVAYRYSNHWEYESELNYYLKYHNPKVPERILDPLLVSLDQGKINFFVSGMAKRYIGLEHKRFYVGLRAVVGAAHLQLERKVCTETVTSGDVCRCLKFETRQLAVKRSIRIFGLRLGYDLPISKRVKFDTYIDIAGFSSKSNTTYEQLRHQSSCPQNIPYAWRNIYYSRTTGTPLSDGILDDFNKHKSNLIYSFGLKLGYAF